MITSPLTIQFAINHNNLKDKKSFRSKKSSKSQKRQKQTALSISTQRTGLRGDQRLRMNKMMRKESAVEKDDTAADEGNKYILNTTNNKSSNPQTQNQTQNQIQKAAVSPEQTAFKTFRTNIASNSHLQQPQSNFRTIRNQNAPLAFYNESRQLSLLHQHKIKIYQDKQDDERQKLKEIMKLKDKAMKNKIHSLNSSLKQIENKYRENLKQGFEHKVKSYRLQAVMQRKAFKQSVDETLRARQEKKLEEKHKRVLEQRQYQTQLANRRQYVFKNKFKTLNQQNHTTQRQMIRRQKQHLQQLLFNRNKSLHDQVVQEERMKGRKKNYLQFWQRQRLSRDQRSMKKQFMEKILSNTQKIGHLKDQLEDLQHRATCYERQAEQILSFSSKYGRIIREIGKNSSQNDNRNNNNLFVTM